MFTTRVLPAVLLGALVALAVVPIGVGWRMMAYAQKSQRGQSRARAAARPAVLAGFDGDRAYLYLLDQCRIGPRISGTAGNRALRSRAADHFRQLGAEVELQPFEVAHPLTREPVGMENVVARWHPDRRTRVLIGAHFDTRPRPDNEGDPRRKAQPFLGANDGASGVAVLMELANLLPDLKTTVGVDLVMFDGEELVYDNQGEYFLGSSRFAELYRAGKTLGRYDAGIVVDMIGDKNLEIYPDVVSMRESPQLVQEVWAVARRLRVTAFRTGRGHDIRDDHLPLLDAGIPAIDLIDFDYGPGNRYWHTLEDTPDKCSAHSLAQVGGVLAEWLRAR